MGFEKEVFSSVKMLEKLLVDGFIQNFHPLTYFKQN